jgi:hypothetical protein
LDYKISVGGEVYYRDATFVSDVYAERRYGFDLIVRKSLTDFTYIRMGYRLEELRSTTSTRVFRRRSRTKPVPT